MPSLRSARRIAIIDDELAFAKLLDGLGYEVIIAPDASYAFDLRDEDIVFLDVLMPDTSGLQLLDQLAQHGSKSPIVLMSRQLERLNGAEKYAESLDFNLIGALEKPFRLSDVREVLAGT